ncbi:hypothetical protein [Streptomyces sp. AC512_CC834]|uniref:hypothetical protein n=1 Tax=Streptomyces sp. AC512_CC834 TaxID=2823691 RepID=UPI001C25BEFC|nr:hypothetical protein [Streptomyces sp. AC512_CC834]
MTDQVIPRGRRARFAAWYRGQDSGVRAAVIGFAGAVVAALIGAAAALAIALIGSRDGASAVAPPTSPSTTPAGQGTGPPGQDPEMPPSEPETTTVSTDTSGTPTSAEPTPTPPVTPTSTPPAPPVRERWRGTLVLDGSAGVRGWFMDPVPPGRAPVGDLAIRGPGQVYGNTLAAWNGSDPPSRKQCVELLNTHLGKRQFDVRVGDRVCFGTEGGRVGAFEVTAVPDPYHLTVAATVWQLP